MSRVPVACVMCVASSVVGVLPSAFAQGCHPGEYEEAVFVQCNGQSQRCDTGPRWDVPTCANLALRYEASISHCSRVGIRVFVDGFLARQTPALNPGETSAVLDLGAYPVGVHQVYCEGYGVSGGCNGGALETWSGTITLFWDACLADCDFSTGPGVLDIFDFLCFQNAYAVNDPYACECDTSTGAGVCDIFDFLCFQNAFAAGCP